MEKPKLSKSNCIFWADVAKGYIIKTLVDNLSSSLSRATFVFDNQGIFSRDGDEKMTIMFNISLLRENFREYKCKERIIFSINIKHLQKLLRNVKKKDAMILFIHREASDQLGISIYPETGSKPALRTETNMIAIFRQNNFEALAPIEESAYRFPVVIEATDFQKIKKLSSVGNTIIITIQGSNYLSFYCDSGEIFSSDLIFGKLVEEDEADNNNSEESDDSTVYKGEFKASIINQLVKLPGLCSQLQFYAPQVTGYPLLIRLAAGLLGTIDIYIKDNATLQKEIAV